MVTTLMWWMWSAFAADCELVRVKDVADVASPAVIVLGERHGVKSDLKRASSVVSTLARKGIPVRVALEAVGDKYQPLLDRYARREVEGSDLPALLDWDKSWGFSYAAYAPLVSASRTHGVSVVAAGPKLGPAPQDAEFPIPSGYASLLRPAMGEHRVSMEQEGLFVQAMAWRDHEIARLALDGWDKQGVVVIVTGRGHVEGGKGVAWQVSRMVDGAISVSSAVLAHDATSLCLPGDRLIR